LHVDDFVVSDREDLEAFVATSVGGEPLGRADDLVRELGELGLDFDPPVAALGGLGFVLRSILLDAYRLQLRLGAGYWRAYSSAAFDSNS